MKTITAALVCVMLASPAYAGDMDAFWGGFFAGRAIRGILGGGYYGCVWRDVPVYDDYGRVVAWRRVCQ